MPPDPDHTPLTTVDEVPEQPMVIAWEALDATTYTTTLHQLAAWVDWLVNTYEPPTQVIPPCWYAHPAQLEDLGHLWTGWLITRHPLSGVGMIGLDWDTRREHTFQRLRETVAATGCTSRQHNPTPPTCPAPTMPTWNSTWPTVCAHGRKLTASTPEPRRPPPSWPTPNYDTITHPACSGRSPRTPQRPPPSSATWPRRPCAAWQTAQSMWPNGRQIPR